ncbi:MAG: nuclear transport factor 2 family protein [Chloroflexota bacterium]|nr:nuclear transport factor 2 family protein [Chloroflexota bacterium]
MKAEPKTEAEVMNVVNQSMEAFVKRDVDALMRLYAPDPDVVVVGTGRDEKRVGPGEIRALFERDVAQFEDASFNFGWYSVSAASSVAWVAADLSLNLKASGRDISLKVRLTNVLEQRGKRWLIVLEHGSLPAAGQEDGEAFPT